jgi:hypothetical membrane protein
MRHRGLTSVLGAIGGVVAPVAFISGWAVTASMRTHYSSLKEAISQLARIGAPHRWLMSVAFFGFGMGLLALAPALSKRLNNPFVRAAITVSAIGALGVAAFPLNMKSGGIEDHTHVFWAVVGYAGTIAAPLLAGLKLRRAHAAVGTISMVVGLLSFGALVGSGFSNIPGFWQRSGLGVVDLWFIAASVWLLLTPTPVAPVAGA